jgi:nucleoside phosphorylase
MGRFALLIGVSDYGKDFPSLPAAEKDVAAMQDVLEDPEIGGFQVTSVVNQEKQKIEEAIEKLFKNRKKDDLLVLFFSGHGVKDEKGTLFLSARNTRKDEDESLMRSTAIEASYVQGWMNHCRLTRKVLILDCCFSGAFPIGMNIKGDDSSIPIALQLGGEGWVVMTSSTSRENSFEVIGFELSVYTHFLVEGIRTGIVNRQQSDYISVEDLHAYAKEKVQETLPGKMTPEIYPAKEGGKILLVKVPNRTNPELVYRQEVEKRVCNGEISIPARALLELKCLKLGLKQEHCAAIEASVLKPFQQYTANLQLYEQTLRHALEHKNSLTPREESDLQDLANFLELKNTDIKNIHQRLINSKISLELEYRSIPRLSSEPEPLPRDIPITSKKRSFKRKVPTKILTIDVLIITTLPKERDALLQCKDLPGSPNNEWEVRKDDLDSIYYWRSFERDDGTSFVVATASASSIGEQTSIVTVPRLVARLRPRCLAMVGICAGNREEDVRLGDIVIADRVFDFDFGKLKAYYNKRQGRREEFLHDLTTYNLCPRWKDQINNLSQQPFEWISSIHSKRPKSDEHQEYWLLHQVYNYQSNLQTYEYESLKSHPDREEECPNWEKVVARLWENNLLVGGKLELTDYGKSLIERSLLLNKEEKDPPEPRIHLGPIGTTSRVIRDPKIFDYIRKVQGRVLGMEMEGNAIGAVAENFEIPMIVVKGVSDYADHSKSDQFPQYAAEASARFLIAFLKKHWPPA